MFEIFIALFGGLYLLGRTTSEKVTSSLYDHQSNTARAQKEELFNESFEEELAQTIANPQKRQNIEALIQEDLQYIYGDAWKTLFSGVWLQPSLYNHPFSSRENIVLTLLLSKSGFVSQRFSLNLTISNFKYANAYECLRILHCIDHNIRSKRKGFNDKLVFLPYIKYKSPPQKNYLGTPDYAHPCSGKFCWSFEFGAIHARYSTDIHNTVLVNACKEASIGERSPASRPYKDKLLL